MKYSKIVVLVVLLKKMEHIDKLEELVRNLGIVVSRMKNQGTILTKIMFFNQLFDKMFLKNDVCFFLCLSTNCLIKCFYKMNDVCLFTHNIWWFEAFSDFQLSELLDITQYIFCKSWNKSRHSLFILKPIIKLLSKFSWN